MASTIYFGYGSNLWLDQMKRRCPSSQYLGVATLCDWRWMINERGYANVVPSKGDVVYGMMYSMTPEDVEKLDGYEGVPDCYIKDDMLVKWVESNAPTEPVDKVTALVYVDVERVANSTPKTEYIGRMNHGIRDAEAHRVPSWYIKKYLRPFIPAPDSNDSG